MISVSAGVRMINAKNKYKGSMSIMVNPQHPLNPAGSGNMVSAPQFFTTLATAASSAASSLQPVIDGGAGGYTLDQLVGTGMLTAAQAAQLSGGLGAAYNPAMTVAQVQGAYQYNAAVMTGYASKTADMEVDATQTGMGFTPMVGVNFNFNKKINIGIKYELNTKLELTNKADADKDANGMFLNDSTFRSDIPAILAAGIEYSVMDNMRVSASWTHYFDKNADWNGREKFVDNNFYEIALGLEYDLSEKITLSCGYLHSQTGVGQGYQTDISFTNSSNTVGFGGRLNVSENLSVDLGALFTMYTSASETKSYPASATVSIPYKETFDKSLMDFSIGVNYKF
jgi:long-subunit fatty acid transport protein